MPRQKRSTEYEVYSTVKKFDTEFARRLSSLVKARQKKIGKEQLSKDLDVSKRVIELWAAQQSRPDIERLSGLATYFGVTVDYLVGKENTPAPTVKETQISDKYGISVNSLNRIEFYTRVQGDDFVAALNMIFESQRFQTFIDSIVDVRKNRLYKNYYAAMSIDDLEKVYTAKKNSDKDIEWSNARSGEDDTREYAREVVIETLEKESDNALWRATHTLTKMIDADIEKIDTPNIEEWLKRKYTADSLGMTMYEYICHYYKTTGKSIFAEKGEATENG